MKKAIPIIMMCLSVCTGMTAQVVSNDNEDGVYKIDSRMSRNDFVPGQVLVKMKDGSPASVRRNARGKFQSAGISNLDKVLQEFGVEEMEQLLPRAKASRTPRRAKAYNGDIIEERDLTQLYRIILPEEKAGQTLQMVEKLETLGEVEFAEPNYKLYLTDASIASLFNSNPFVYQQWYLDAYGVKQLWNKPIINPKRPVIAIIDTGVDMTHPDLVDNLWTNTAEAEGEEGYDNDGNGFNSDVHGWDFVNNTPNVRDNNMHGTHVAGIAAAANNGIGIIGANPQALIMPVSVLQSNGTGDVATIVKGIDYAVQNGADVLNLSLGTYANSRSMCQSLERAYQTAVIVAAAGNDGRCINSNHHPTPHYGAAPMFPGAYSFVLGVQATQQNGSLAGFSNFDDDGNTFSSVTTFQDPDGYNYELMAPGVNILSTIPGGKYKVLSGTSMASPLVAGAISALMMVKKYDTQEILWGDLLHTDNIAQAFAVTNRPAELDLMKIQLRDRKELADETEEDYSGDHEIDAGETVSIYPVIRTTFGEASNIKMHLEMGDEFEDPSVVEIYNGEDNKVDFGWHLDAYGKGVSLNPLELKIADNIADGRHIKLKIVVTCDESDTAFVHYFTIVVSNVEKLSGILTNDKTLVNSKNYLINGNVAIMEGTTLTIEPGTHIQVSAGYGISVEGHLIAKGTPSEHIVFVGKDRHDNNHQSLFHYSRSERDTIEYCQISKCFVCANGNDYLPVLKDCEVNDCYYIQYNGQKRTAVKTTFTQGSYEFGWGGSKWEDYTGFFDNYCNLVNIPPKHSYFFWEFIKDCNVVNVRSINYDEKYTFIYNTQNVSISHNDNPPYIGTSKEKIAMGMTADMNTGYGFGVVDFSNMRLEPFSEAHGIVWKVCVNGKDAQDEYEDLAPLGVGKHKFEVYFNRPMNKAVAPQITFGVREPYTQQIVAEDGSWNEEGTIYTAYKTIDGKTKSDGVNRIYVWGAEDNEYFEIPYEKTRFNINIQAAGSMATGFAAEGGMGKVNLMWNNDENDFDDAMGFNIYRYTVDWEGKADTLRINTQIVDIETTEYTDYDVVPGQTYYYMYKVLSTDLKEYDVSNVVAATPLTANLGDANGDTFVDVADVITTVNQITGMEPKPFIFEAADVNVDKMIDVLDVIGIIQKILNPGANTFAMSEAEATYTIEDGTLYVESPVALAGVQVQLSNSQFTIHNSQITVAEDLNGFEHTSAWPSDNDYLFLAYNMNGKTLTPGKHALLHIGDAMIAQIRLSDANGHNVLVTGDDATKVNRMASDVMTIPGIYDMQGRKLSGNTDDVKLPKGVYIINGQKVVR